MLCQLSATMFAKLLIAKILKNKTRYKWCGFSTLVSARGLLLSFSEKDSLVWTYCKSLSSRKGNYVLVRVDNRQRGIYIIIYKQTSGHFCSYLYDI